MNSTPAGTELARRTAGMQPTDAEFEAMFRIAWQNWVDTGGVYGLWRAVPVSPDLIAAADERMNAALKGALGPDRYLDYQMATSEIGQQLRNLAARYDLPRESLIQAYQLQAAAAPLIKAIAQPLPSVDPAAPPTADQLQLHSRLAELQQQTERILGPTLWQAWIDGKDRRVILDP